MSKIVRAVNAMLSNSQYITEVSVNESEYFFLYKAKYKWSIRNGADSSISLWFYPGSESLADLINVRDHEWEHVPMVHYSDKEIGTKEAKSSFNELYNLIKEKIFGIDSVLDDIISDLEID